MDFMVLLDFIYEAWNVFSLFLLKKVVKNSSYSSILENMLFFMFNCVKKSSKFGQVVVNYGCWVGFEYQLGFIEFCSNLALENVRVLGKTQGDFPTNQLLFFVLKSLKFC
jgi:hypothetical protein